MSLEAIYFSSPAEFRKWLEGHHDKEKEVLAGYYKVGTGKPSMTWSESVDQALCFGWIDGIRRSVDESRYTIRFTPRKPTSNWSAVNIQKMDELTKQGLMTPAGLAAYEKRKESRSRIYSYENRPEKLSSDLERLFKTNKPAWKFFNEQPPGYRKTIYFWIMDAKQEATRISRLNKLIMASAAGERVI